MYKGVATFIAVVVWMTVIIVHLICVSTTQTAQVHLLKIWETSQKQFYMHSNESLSDRKRLRDVLQMSKHPLVVQW